MVQQYDEVQDAIPPQSINFLSSSCAYVVLAEVYSAVASALVVEGALPMYS